MIEIVIVGRIDLVFCKGTQVLKAHTAKLDSQEAVYNLPRFSLARSLRLLAFAFQHWPLRVARGITEPAADQGPSIPECRSTRARGVVERPKGAGTTKVVVR